MAMGRGQFLRKSALNGMCLLLVGGAVALASMAGFAADAGKTPVMSPKAKRGSVLFQQNCVSCHNKEANDTTPFGPPNLHGIFSAKPLVHPALTPTEAAEFIRKGKAPMPAFGGMLTEAQIGELIAYLKVQ